MKFLRTSTDVLSCEGIRRIEVTDMLNVAVTYEDNRTLVLQPQNRYIDDPDKLAEYIRSKLLTRIIDFLLDEEHAVGGYTLRPSYSFMVEDVIQEIISPFYGKKEDV